MPCWQWAMRLTEEFTRGPITKTPIPFVFDRISQSPLGITLMIPGYAIFTMTRSIYTDAWAPLIYFLLHAQQAVNAAKIHPSQVEQNFYR